jgi:WD40 repeat protein
VYVSPTSSYVVLVPYLDNAFEYIPQLFVFRYPSLEAAASISLPTLHLNPDLCFAPDGTRLLAWGSNAQLVDLAEGRVVDSLHLPADEIAFSAACDPEGLMLFASASRDSLYVRSVGGACILSHPVPDSLTRGLWCRLSENGARLVAGASKRTEILDVRSGRHLAPKQWRGRGPVSCYFSPSGRYLSEYMFDAQRWKLWDLERDTMLIDIPGTCCFEQACAYSPGEGMLAYVNDDMICVATLPEGRELLRFQHLEPWPTRFLNPHALQFTADGGSILTTSWSVKRWILPPGIHPKAL